MKRLLQSGWSALVLLGLVASAGAQVNMGEAAMNLSGDAGFAFNQTFAETNQNQWGLVLDANLSGFYYNPKFFAFRFSPYYNTNRANALSNSIFSTKGFFSSGDLFSGSNTPISFSYQRDWNAQGTYNLPGTPGFTTNGNSQVFTVTGGAYFPDWPSLQVSFSKGSDNYEIIGANSNGASSLRLFNVTSNYRRWGFDFGASYSNSHLGQETPLIIDLNQVVTMDTNTNTWQFNVSRDLWHSAHWSSSFARTHYTTDSYNSTAEQSYDSVYDNLTWQPTDHLMFAANMTYTDNAGSYLLTLIPGGNPGDLLPLFNDSNYLVYGVHATYMINRNITLDGGASQTAQSYFGVHMDSTNEYAAIGYNHSLFGGQFGAHYGVNHFTAPFTDQNSFGNVMNATYTKRMAGWQFGFGGNLNTNQMTALLSYDTTFWSANASASRSFHDWLVMVSGVMGKNVINGLNGSNGDNNNYSVAVSHRNVSFNAAFNHNSGWSLPTATGLVPVPIPIPGLLVTYNGSSYAFGGGYTPTRRLQFSASYSHSLYETGQSWLDSNSMFTRFDARAEYTFRQMHITGAFTHLTQGVGANFGTPQTVNGIYFSITRHFDIF